MICNALTYFAVNLDLNRRFMSARLDVICPYLCSNQKMVHSKTNILIFMIVMFSIHCENNIWNASEAGLFLLDIEQIKGVLLISAIAECWHIKFLHVR